MEGYDVITRPECDVKDGQRRVTIEGIIDYMKMLGTKLESKVENGEHFVFFQAEDGIRDLTVTGVQTCALPISIGVRIPDHPVPRMLVEELGEPLMSSTLLLPDDPQPLTRGLEIQERLRHDIDAILDGGDCGIEPTTVVDLSATPPVIVRKGKAELGAIT